MLNAVKAFHEKNSFDVSTKNTTTMLYRQNLLMEELGEISECLTKGREDIGEEHADLFILLLGNCVVMDIDLEHEFWKKMEKINNRTSKSVAGHNRVSDWENKEK